MQIHPNELYLYQDSRSDLGKKTLAVAKSICNHINEVDCIKTTLSTTMWQEIIGLLQLKPKELLDRSSEYYIENIKGNDITMQGFLDILKHNPTILKGPIAIKGNKAIICKTPTDILKVA